MTAALSANSRFQVTAGVEIELDYADEWQVRHPEATLVQADIRSVPPTELPPFDVLIAGIPCTSHSNLGRAKKGLARKPELKDTGDLFLPVITFVSERMPAAVVFENVTAFATSLAGELLATFLQRIGYHVFTTNLQPNDEWGEIEDRKRWLLVGTLDKPFTLTVPHEPCRMAVSDFLDAPDAGRDREDAERINKTIEGLRLHNARHRELGHGFGFTVVNGTETKLPTIPLCRPRHNGINAGSRIMPSQVVDLVNG